MSKQLFQSPDFLQKLQNPLVIDWALHYLRQHKTLHAPNLNEVQELLFPPKILRYWLDQDEERLKLGFFRLLQPECFEPFIEEILQDWPEYGERVAGVAAPVLARLAPDQATALFARHLPPSAARDSGDRATGVIRSLHLLQGEEGDRLGKEWLDFLWKHREPFYESFREEALFLAWSRQWEIASEMFYSLFAHTEEDEQDRAFQHLDALYKKLYNDLPFFALILGIHEKKTDCSFRDLAIYFEEEAPLADLDGLALLSRKGLLPLAAELLKETLTHHPDGQASFLLQHHTSWAEKLPEANQPRLAHFFLALAAAQWLRPSWDFSTLSLQETIDLLSLDLAKLPALEAIALHLQSFPPKEVSSLLSLSTENLNNNGLDNIVAIIGHLAWTDLLEPTLSCISRQRDLWLCEQAQKALLRFGEKAEERLCQRWDSLDTSQKIYGFIILELIGGPRTIELLLDIYPTLQDSLGLENWCFTARAVPDQRLIDILEPELRRQQVLIDETFLLLCTFLDHDHPSLPALQEKAERRKRELFKDTKELLEDGISGLLQKEHCVLELTCSACGQNNKYEVHKVFMDPRHKEDPPYIGDELECLSCGEVADFTIAPMGYMALMAEMVRFSALSKQEEAINTPLQFATARLADGREVSVGQAIKHYRDKIERDPQDLVALLSLGNCYRHAGKQRRARSCYEQCLHVDPGCAEAAYQLALMLERDDLEPQEALQTLEQTWQRHRQWQFYRLTQSTPREVALEYMGEYNRLRQQLKRKDLPYLTSSVLQEIPAIQKGADARSRSKARELPVEVSRSARPPRRSQTPATNPTKRVGRNDPCPCGSGKKYKKCCLRKESTPQK